MTDDLKTKLREILFDLLADGEDISDGDAEAWNHTWKVSGDHLDRLCELVGLYDVADAQDSIAREILAGKRGADLP